MIRSSMTLSFPIPRLRAKLEEASSRHSPLASASPAEGIACSLPDALPADERARLDTRRKSTSWKGFNLKRQLSKVDLKLKAAFVTAAPDDPEGDDDVASPARPDPFERMHRELHERSACAVPGSTVAPASAEPVHTPAPASEADDVYERIHRELQERWQERERDESGEPPPRPDNLPLFEEEECRPVRPPRHRPATRADDRRDQRLLSVPNIKYNKSNTATAAHEVARKRSAGSGAFAGTAAAVGAGSGTGGSFAGNLMRRFSKYRAAGRGRGAFASSLTSLMSITHCASSIVCTKSPSRA
ncbi:hypothetical protein EVAR_62307_1 [Eumeta japonica]|uniref:Uncharacterized protein n=1 Tax=Eumeta variegata TaxID=151549 RepID=A0A4C1ZHW9_EUMVA|nr:hypothetical protein EVAR_62307_1 [Eumeta japonica]